MKALGCAFGLEGPYRRRARAARVKEWAGAALIAGGLAGLFAWSGVWL